MRPVNLVDQDDLSGLDDVVAVALEQGVGLKSLIGVMDDGYIFDVVERLTLQQILLP